MKLADLDCIAPLYFTIILNAIQEGATAEAAKRLADSHMEAHAIPPVETLELVESLTVEGMLVTTYGAAAVKRDPHAASQEVKELFRLIGIPEQAMSLVWPPAS
ncbi:hypothetical protein [Chondromyces apiculatus]|uniref:Uncharacterized protein n=1 Tax=Chondromyces apiculatus DSM 436 TaxID=1192034 RepID=A0A017TE40_9BACT|nr:hypothetical protein [Chondromyces apiculatus]EYF07070.1 Hypothetical protein CAP_1329 [Chondromyces apiculatus DSM 436]